MAGGLTALLIGLLTFLILSLLTVVTPAVSGVWLIVPCLVMLAGVAAVTAWLVFGEGARRFDTAPIAFHQGHEQWHEQWQWGPSER